MIKLEYYFLVKLARDAEIDSENLEGKNNCITFAGFHSK